MKKTRYFFAALVLVAGSMTFTSCVRNEYYTPEPDYPNNNNNDIYSFTEEFSNDNRGWAFSSSADSSYASVSGTNQYEHQQQFCDRNPYKIR